MTPPHTVRPRLGIIGGTGLYRLPGADVLAAVSLRTPFGAPSGRITIACMPGRPGQRGGRPGPPVAFLSRHGDTHSVAPQQVNYRANLWALKSLGVEAVISSAAVGGLVPAHGPGTFAVPEQFLDRTWGRADTYYDGSAGAGVQHLPAADPYSPRLRAALLASLEALDEEFSPNATVAVINGPRFSTRAESAALVQAGAHLVSMTQYPEPVLAAELNMAYAALAFITDADTGHDGSEPVTAELVLGRLAAAQPRILAVLSCVAAAWADDSGLPEPGAMPAGAVAALMGAPASDAAAEDTKPAGR